MYNIVMSEESIKRWRWTGCERYSRWCRGGALMKQEIK